MSQVNLKDKSWGVIFILFFVAPPIGIIALVVKVIYTIYKSQEISNEGYTTKFESNPLDEKDYRYQSTSNDYSEDLQELEATLVDAFDQWQGEGEVLASTMTETPETKVRKLETLLAPVHVELSELKAEEIQQKPEPIKVDPFDYLMTDDLESRLNISTEALEVPDAVEVTTDIDLTFTDVHIDTEITFDDEPEDHDHVGEEPLKVITCRMCGTKNRIYIIDKFETPTCEQCGMLLLD